MSTARVAGLAALQSGDIQTAIAELEAAVQEDPSDFDACLYLGGAYGQAGRTLDAIKSVTQAVQLQPANAQARYNLGVAMEQGGYAEQALQVYNQVLQLQPDYPNAQTAITRLQVNSNHGFGSPVSASPSTIGSGQQFGETQPAQQPTQQFGQSTPFGQQQQQQQAPYNPLAPTSQQGPEVYSPLASPQQSAQPTQAFTPPAQQTQGFARPPVPVGQPQQPVEAGLGSYMAPPPAPVPPASGQRAPVAYGARPGAYSSVPSYDDEFKLSQAFKDLFRALFSPKALFSEMAGCDTTRSAWSLFVVYSLLMMVVYGIVGGVIGSKIGVGAMAVLVAELDAVLGILSLLIMWAIFALIVHLMSRAFGSSLRFGASMRCVIYSGAPSVIMALISILGFGIVASSAIGLVKSTPGMMDGFTSARTSTRQGNSATSGKHTSAGKSSKLKSSSSNPFAASGGSATTGSNPFGNMSAPGSNPFAGAGTLGSNPFGTGVPGSGFGAPSGPLSMLWQEIMGAYLLLGLIGLVGTVWIMTLLGFAISNIHEISGGSAAGVVVLSAIIYTVVCVGLVFLMVMVFGVAFASMGSAMGASASGMH